jgi:glycosyltransferase involved in cell wall biosynthesis
MTAPPSNPTARVLIATPVKNASRHLGTYFTNLARLTYPAGLISLGFLEGDSDDDTFDQLRGRSDALAGQYRRCGVWQRHTGFRLPPGAPRWAPTLQLFRRKAIAKARNHLLSRALDDEDWVMWLDVDVIATPPDLIEQLLATGRDILHPHCVKSPGGPSFDLNAWRDGGQTHMDAMRGQGDLVRLDSVGGTVLMIRADIHRDGLIFPPYLYGSGHRLARRPGPWTTTGQVGEVETEGLALMAADMGHQCWGMPHLEVVHAPE